MKTLRINVDQSELGRVGLNSPTIIMGRSPICDYVLRRKGIAPIHFIVEWFGAGEFDANQGKWVIIPITNSENISDKDAKKMGYGEGIILSAKPIELDGFVFDIVEDKLAESHLTPGLVSEKLTQETRIPENRERNTIELVKTNSDSGSVIDVVHVPIAATRTFLFDNNGSVRLDLNMQGRSVTGKVEFINMNGAQVNVRGSNPDDFKINGFKTIDFYTNDFIHINREMKDYYIRLVPKVQAPRTRSGIWSDYFLVLILLVLFSSLFALLYLRDNFVETIEEIKPPPRIAKIEVKETAPPEPEKPKPPPEESKPEPKKPEPVAKKKPEQKPQPVVKKETPGGTKLSEKPKPPKPINNSGLVSPAPKKSSNVVGMLGALKSNTTATVSADQVINKGIVSETISSPGATLKIDQPPVGRVGNKTSLTRGNTVVGASTTLDLKDAVRGDGIGALAGGGKGNGKALGNANFSTLGDMAISDGFGDESESVTGGLDKESVRRALRAYKRDIGTCYDRALATKSQISGKIRYNWHINPDGTVRSVSLINSTADSVKLEECVLNVIKSIRFPVASNGKSTIVIYPFVFQQRNR